MIRRVGIGLALAGALAVGAFAAPREAAASCDPSYPDVCVAPAAEVGDLDCADIGSALRVVHDASIGAYDSHGFDADLDGIGCESY